MNLSDHARRVATLAAITDFVAEQYATARREAEAAFRENRVSGVTITLPDGEEIGDIKVKKPSPTVRVSDDDLVAWVEKHTATELEEYLDADALTDQELIEWARVNRDDLLRRRVRAVWRKELVKLATANGGYVVDTETGESAKVAEVVPNKATGAFALSQDPRGERRARIIAALRAGELEGVTTLAISAPAEGGEPNG